MHGHSFQLSVVWLKVFQVFLSAATWFSQHLSLLWNGHFIGPELGKIWASNEEMNVNFHRAFQHGQSNDPMASAPLWMLGLDSVFSLLARFPPWNGHRLEMTR